jgi:hypothetical protein
MDSNCDGIDGDRTRAAFVATNGTDTGSCRLEAPCATLQFALALVASDPVLEQVFLQAGLYAEGGLELPDGVEVFGGYNSSWERAERNQPGHTAEISGGYVAALDASYTVRVDHASAGMADLVLVGPSAAFPSLSSHVVLAREASLWLQRVTLVLGDGADGAAGSTGIGANPAPAPAGGPGEPGDEFESVCDLYRPPGGPGASNPQCPGPATAGGAGGSGGSMDTNCNGPLGSCGNCDARPGLSGSAGVGSGSTGGTGGGLCGGFPGSGSSTAPSDGAGGAPAPPGGYIDVAGTWRANAGLAGAVGSHGFGGGGGGGAGGCDIGADDRGPGGGGGGAGGLSGAAGWRWWSRGRREPRYRGCRQRREHRRVLVPAGAWRRRRCGRSGRSGAAWWAGGARWRGDHEYRPWWHRRGRESRGSRRRWWRRSRWAGLRHRVLEQLCHPGRQPLPGRNRRFRWSRRAVAGISRSGRAERYGHHPVCLCRRWELLSQSWLLARLCDTRLERAGRVRSPARSGVNPDGQV